MERPDNDEYFMEMAQLIAKRSTCLRRRVGAVLVKDKRVLSTGYNGSPKGTKHCEEEGCIREQMKIPRGERYELCRSVHAEQNAIIAAPREQMLGATLYMACTLPDGTLQAGTNSCMMCKRTILNAGISTVVVRDTPTEYRVVNVADWIEDDDSLNGRLGY